MLTITDFINILRHHYKSPIVSYSTYTVLYYVCSVRALYYIVLYVLRWNLANNTYTSLRILPLHPKTCISEIRTPLGAYSPAVTFLYYYSDSGTAKFA